jgi:archaellum component FlaC
MIDDFESDINAADVSKISDARSLFDSIHHTVSEADAIPLHFDSRESLLSRIEELGNEVFDLETHLGATAVSLPEDLEDLRDLNDTVEEHMGSLSQLDQNLSTIQSESESIQSKFDACKTDLENLLTKEEVVAHEQ